MKKHSHPSKPKQKKKKSVVNPSASQLSYNGPYLIPGSREQNTLYTLELKSVLSLTSDVSGVINSVYDNNQSGYLDWSSIDALWDEYRPLALRVSYEPNNRYSKTTTVTVPIYCVIDRDSLGAIASKNAAVQYESCKINCLDDPWSKGVKAIGLSGLTTHQFVTTASPAGTFCIKLYATGASNSTIYGDVLVTLLIQVRGRN
jgi:hypothetical protein